MSSRPQLHGGGSERVRRLQFMTTLQPLAALTAATDMHIEATLNRFLWELDLILLSDMRRSHIGRFAMRTSLRQRDLDDLIQLILHRSLPPSLLAILRVCDRASSSADLPLTPCETEPPAASPTTELSTHTNSEPQRAPE